MRAIFWKELRENAKWGALALLIFSLALAYGWTKVADPLQYYDSYQSLLSPVLGMVTSLGAAILGGALGMLQIIPEQARDRWAFLVHRPVKIAGVFWGKSLAGVLLYSLATLPPYLILSWWASQPGHLAAPFDWRMGLAGLSDIATGLCFYFAGMLTALRRGRWYGGRALAIPGAVFVLLLASRQMEFWQSIAWIAFYTVAFVIAARGAFCANGSYAPQGALARCAVFLVVLVGVMQILGWGRGMIETLTPRDVMFSGVQYNVLKDGTPFRAVYQNGNLSEMRTLSGQKIEMPPEKLARIYDEQLFQLSFALSPRSWNVSYRQARRYVWQLGSFLMNDMWYFIKKKNLYAEYDRGTLLCKGYLTEKGFMPGAHEPPAGFSGKRRSGVEDFYQNWTPIYDNTLFAVNPVKLSVTAVYQAPPEAPLLGAAAMPSNNQEPIASAKFFAFVVPGQFGVVDAGGSVRFMRPLAHDPEKWSEFEVAAMPDGSRFFVFIQPNYRAQSQAGNRLPGYFEEYDAAGRQTASVELPPYRQPGRPPTFRNFLFGTLMLPAVEGYNQARGRLLERWGDPRFANFSRNFRAGWSYTRVSWAGMFSGAILSLILGAVVMRPQKMSIRARAIWLAAIFLTGLAGLLAFLAVRTRTKRVSCPKCAAPRLVDEGSCGQCGEDWPAPQADGTEIFVAQKAAG